MPFNIIDEIPHDLFSNVKQIGSGSFSSIFSAIHIKTNTKVALKVSIKSQNTENNKLIEQEISINKMLHHPFICKFFTEIETEHFWIIVMEIIDGITSLDYVNRKEGLPIDEARNIFVQLLIAIEYLHFDVHITHRDLKLENIMLDNYGYIRLIDFGLSSFNTMMSTRCGSIAYCAPEILTGDLYTNEADIWSMGIILYALIKGDLPFYHTDVETLANIICMQEVAFSDKFDEDLQDLLSKMLEKDFTQRIKIEEIKHHPFVLPEKLLQINYKQLFSPSNSNQNHFPQISQFDKNAHYACKSTEKFESISSPKFVRFQPALLLNANLNVQRRKSSFVRASNPFFILPQNQEALREKINNVTNDLDHSIESRKNFPFLLNSLIETAFRTDLNHHNEDNGNSKNLTKVQFLNLNARLDRRCSHNHILYLQGSKAQPLLSHTTNKIHLNDICEEKNNSFNEEQ